METNTITYIEAKNKLDEYYEQRAKSIRNVYKPTDNKFSEAFLSLGLEIGILERGVNMLFGFANEDPHEVMRPKRMD